MATTKELVFPAPPSAAEIRQCWDAGEGSMQQIKAAKMREYRQQKKQVLASYIEQANSVDELKTALQAVVEML